MIAIRWLALLAIWWAIRADAAVADPATSAPRSWRPIADDVYLQEVGRQIATPEPVLALAAWQGRIHAGTGRGGAVLEGGRLVPIAEVPGPVARLVATPDALWAMGEGGLHAFADGAWRKVATQPVQDVCAHEGQVVALSENRLWRADGGHLVPLSTNACPFPAARVVSFQETLILVGPGQLVTFADGQFGSPNLESGKPENAWDWGHWPSPSCRDALALGSRLFVATDRGLGVLRGMSLTSLRGADGLPSEDTTCLARGPADDLWIGTARGAIRMLGHGSAGPTFHYFAGARWLPDDGVHAVAALSNTVYIATARGLGIVAYEPFTLLKKAGYYERWLEEKGQKRLGFVHKLEWDAPSSACVREISDNDGGYSEDYLAAECYRFAVTGEAAARREATNTFHAMRWLEAITGLPGFPARAVWVKGEPGHKSMQGSGGYPAEWHEATDARFEWKGDTSSDEIDAHFYGVAIFRELAARDREIAQAATFLGRLAAHLQDHQWQLIDLDGKPTRWGRWDPAYYTQTTEGFHARGLGALEMLSFMKTAAALTGEARFAAGYADLIGRGYPNFTIRASVTFPPDFVAHFDDQLAFWAYANLLRYETNSPLRSVYRRSLERSYELVRGERNPWLNFVYGSLAGDAVELDASAAHLREWPLDLAVYTYRNSHRADYQPSPGYANLKGGVRAFSPRETQPMRWDHWTMEPDGGSADPDVEHPAGWLLAYWLGRYAGFIEAPRTADPELRGAAALHATRPGARAYDGPPRPAGF